MVHRTKENREERRQTAPSLKLALTVFFKLGGRPLFRVELMTDLRCTVIGVYSNYHFKEEVMDPLFLFVMWREREKETKGNWNSFCQS